MIGVVKMQTLGNVLLPSNTSLTKREFQILQLVAQGRKSAEISVALGLSKHTVDKHRKNMLHKTDCNTFIELVVWAMRNNLIQ